MKRLTLSLIALFLLVCDASAANRFLTCNTACTITASDTTIWGTTTGGTGASVPGSSDAVILDGATCVGGTTCTATMGAGYNPTWQSITMGACTASTTGCIFDWSVNNNSPTLTASNAFSGSGTGTRNFKMGNGTWTISNNTAASTLWTMATTTNLTFTANSSTIVFSGNSTGTLTFNGGGLTYSTVTFNGASSRGGFIIAGSNTIATLNVAAPNVLGFTNSTTTTVTNAFAFVGTSANPIDIQSTSFGSAATISIATGTATLTWGSVRGLTCQGGATFTASNAFDNGFNSGITITGPTSGGGPNIIGGWLLERDFPANDNFMALWEKAA